MNLPLPSPQNAWMVHNALRAGKTTILRDKFSINEWIIEHVSLN